MHNETILYDSVKTKTNKSIKDVENFAHRAIETTFNIKENASMAEKEYRRCLAYLEETVSVLYALHTFDGLLKTELYNAQIDLLKESLTELRERLGVKAYTLVIVENNSITDALTFEDQFTLNNYCQNNFGCEYTDLTNPMKIKPEYLGTRIFERKFGMNEFKTLDTFKIGY